MNAPNSDSVKLLNQHKKRIILVYEAALKSFKSDLSLWKEYINFLISAVSLFTYLIFILLIQCDSF